MGTIYVHDERHVWWEAIIAAAKRAGHRGKRVFSEEAYKDALPGDLAFLRPHADWRQLPANRDDYKRMCEAGLKVIQDALQVECYENKSLQCAAAPAAAVAQVSQSSGGDNCSAGADLKPADVPQSTDPEALRIRQLRTWQSFRDCPECPELLVVAAGQYAMGSRLAEKEGRPTEGPQRTVNVASFALGKYELSWSEFRLFVSDTGRPITGECRVVNAEKGEGAEPGETISWEDPGYKQKDKSPVVCVSWNDAKAYAAWLSTRTGHRYRLPSEAEWEYAARAGLPDGSSDYWGGDSARACRFANVADETVRDDGKRWAKQFACNDAEWWPAEVGRYRPNAFGFFDMLGNVWEWVEDCVNPGYAGAPVDGRAWTCGRCDRRIIRGSAWSSQPSAVRFSKRASKVVDMRSDSVGFRIARDLE